MGSTRVSVGPADRLPEWDLQTNVVSNATEQVSVGEGELVALDLDAGAFWLWTSNVLTITLSACEPGTVLEVVPVA